MWETVAVSNQWLGGSGKRWLVVPLTLALQLMSVDHECACLCVCVCVWEKERKDVKKRQKKTSWLYISSNCYSTITACAAWFPLSPSRCTKMYTEGTFYTCVRWSERWGPLQSQHQGHDCTYTTNQRAHKLTAMSSPGKQLNGRPSRRWHPHLQSKHRWKRERTRFLSAGTTGTR